ncbi:MAG TPA: TonB-dependent receptor [Sphingomicrobium sp.]|nr:TonB-dependent receptor [Sphingomicrobium sp.]
MQMVSVRAVLLGSVAAAAVFATPVSAQENPATSLELAENQETVTEASDASDQEIVVTARRRTELLLDVPIAVTAYSGEQLARQGALDITDVGDTTPNVTLEVSRGTNTTLTAFIRGVGQQDPVAGFEQGVGLYLDDVYLNRPQAAVLDIYEVERIEVLRGPQGTLYGRNTIGGAIKYVTRRIADEPRFSARANLGTDRRADLILTASTPIGDALKIGGSVARLSHGGYGKNLTTGADNYNRDIWAARATVELQPSPTVWFRLSGDQTWDNSNPRGGHRLIPGLASGAPVLSNVFDTRGGLNDPDQRVRSGGLALHGEVDLNEWLKFRTITAYRRDRTATPIDFDALPAVDLDVPAIYKNRQFSQELQLLVERGPLAGVVGAYYLDANAFNIFDVRLYTLLPGILPGLTASTEGDVDTKTWAIFGDFTYDLTPQWAVSLGGRYTNDKRKARVLRQTRILGGQPALGGAQGFGTGVVIATTSNFEGQRKDTAFTPRASVSFKPNRNHNLYLSYSRGFKGGGFDPRGQSTQAPTQSPQDVFDFMAFDPETVDSYELGWKASLFANRLQLATAIFHADYQDVQVPGSSGCVVGGVQTFCGITTNAGKARFRGVEFEGNLRVAEDMAAAGDRLNLAGSLGYLDAEYREFITNIPGQGPVDVANFRRIQNTPKWTMSGSLDYSTPAWGGRLFANTTVSYRSSSQQFEIASPGLDQKGFALWDANLVWRSPGNRFEVGLHGKNLTDKEYIVAGYNFLVQNPFTGAFILNANGNPISALGREGVLTAYYGNPRQVFLSLGVNF